MKKIFIIFYILTSSSYASYEILDTKYIYTIKMKSGSFEDTFIQLKNEIAHNSYVIINELNLAKSTNNIAKVLDKKEILNKGKTFLICKGTFALQMLEENISNITYCPLAISIYEKNLNIFISFRKYKSFSTKDTIANEINKQLKKVILNSLKD